MMRHGHDDDDDDDDKPVRRFSKIQPGGAGQLYSNPIKSGHITAFIWIGCIAAFFIFMMMTGEGGTAAQVDASGGWMFVDVKAAGKDFLLAVDDYGKQYQLKMPTLMDAYQHGKVVLGDRIRVRLQ